MRHSNIFEGMALALELALDAYHYFRENVHFGTFVRHPDRAGDNPKEIERGLSVIAETDPQFEIMRFRHSVASMALAYHQALAQGDAESVRAFVSDGVYERLLFQIQEREIHGRASHVPSLTIHEVRPLQVVASKNREHAFDTITLLVTCLRGDREVREVWTMLRRRGAKTRADEVGLATGQCPNCGHDIRKTQWDRCPACDSLLRSGEHDWVLSVITQWEHYRPQNSRQINSAMRYWIKHDPGFSSHALRDRASVIFFRKAIADRTGEVTPLKKVGSPDFVQTYRQQLTIDPGGQRPFHGQVEIESVEVKGVIQAEPMDQALVAVRWTAADGLDGPDGMKLDERKRRNFHSLLILNRRTGARSKIERVISSSHCPQCGAPETSLGGHTCDYCHVPLNDGKLDWVLAEIIKYTSTRSLQLRKKANEGVETTAVLVNFPTEDGRSETRVITHEVVPEIDSDAIDGVEINGQAPMAIVRLSDRHLLHLVMFCTSAKQRTAAPIVNLLWRIAQLCGIEQGEFQQIVANFKPDQPLRLPTQTPQFCRRWIALVAEAALSDGKIAPWQEQLLARVGKELKFSRFDIQREIRFVTRTLADQRSLGTEATLIAWVVRTVVANGRLTPEERATLQESAAAHGISAGRLNQMVEQAQNNELALPDPAESQTARSCLRLMLDHAIADGEICEAEKRVLQTFGKRIGMADFEIDHAIKKCRSEHFRAARQKQMEASQGASMD